MLRSKTERLEDLIISAFSEQPHLTAAELGQAVARRGRRYTVQAVYQELRKLQAERVITKVGDRYMLRVAWVLEMVEFTDRMYESYVRRGALTKLLPAGGEKVSWRIPTVSRLVTFWAQVNLAVIAASEDSRLFEFLPHVWFHLAARADEEQFLTGLDLTGASYFCAVGGDTFLDRSYSRYAGLTESQIRFGQSPFRTPVDSYHGIAGDFLMTVKLNRKIKDEIEKIYSSVTKSQDVAVGSLSELFNQKEHATFSVERGTARAAKYRKEFVEFFGVSKSAPKLRR